MSSRPPWLGVRGAMYRLGVNHVMFQGKVWQMQRSNKIEGGRAPVRGDRRLPCPVGVSRGRHGISMPTYGVLRVYIPAYRYYKLELCCPK